MCPNQFACLLSCSDLQLPSTLPYREHAVKATFGQGIEAAINWILSHPQNPNADEKGKEQQELQLQSEQVYEANIYK